MYPYFGRVFSYDVDDAKYVITSITGEEMRMKHQDWMKLEWNSEMYNLVMVNKYAFIKQRAVDGDSHRFPRPELQHFVNERRMVQIIHCNEADTDVNMYDCRQVNIDGSLRQIEWRALEGHDFSLAKYYEVENYFPFPRDWEDEEKALSKQQKSLLDSNPDFCGEEVYSSPVIVPFIERAD